jgi:hypothetical protein
MIVQTTMEALRLETLRTIVAHVESGLPCPARIDMTLTTTDAHGSSVELWFDEDAGAVDAWAELLKLTVRRDNVIPGGLGYKPFRSYGAHSDHDGVAWIGWSHAEAITYLPVRGE